jgi:hypothetical protein
MTRDETWLRSQIEAYHTAALAFTAVKLGVPDRIGDRAVEAGALAGELNLSFDHLHRFLRGLAAIGLCTEADDGRFQLTPLGHALREGAPSRLAEKVAIVVGQYWRPWADLARTLANGGPAFEHVFGLPVWAWRREQRAEGALFDAYLAGESFATSGEILEALDLADVKTVADIGGGYGGLLAGMLKARPDLEGVLFDLPSAVEAALPFLVMHGVADRIRLAGGSFFSGLPVKADLYLLKGVLQQSDDAGALTILRACRRAMPGRATLAIIERLMPERAADDPAAALLDLHMMTISGGKARSLAEIEALLGQAALRPSGVKTTRSGLSIVQAAPAY